MAKKIKIVSGILIALIILGAVIGIRIVSGQTVKAVSNIVMKDNTSSSILVEWERLSKVDGYYLYNYDKVNDKYEKLSTIKGGNKNSCKLDKLSGSTIYDLRVFGYRSFMKKEYVSTEAESVCIYTLPDALEICAFSGSKGVLSAEWQASENLSGYEIQYSKSKDFKNCQTEKIKSGDARNMSVTDLKPDDTYYIRGRAFMNVDGKQIYGEWGNTSSTVIYDKELDIGTINPNRPMIAFSFDDGPAFDYKGENSTAKILDVLEKYGASATFFMVGERVDNETKALLQREIALNCELGNHTYSHKHYGSDVTVSDIKKASDRIKKYCGKTPTIFRCPGGNLTKAIRNECKDENMPIAYWSVDTLDWKTKDEDKIYKKTVNQVYDGCIVLMHDIYPSTADAVEKLVPELIKKGYQIVSVSQLIEAKTGDVPRTGQQYVDYETINNNTK